MILCDKEIKEALDAGSISIDPRPTQEQYATSSVDLILGDEFLRLLTPEELDVEEPHGAVRSLEIDTVDIDIRAFLNRYAKKLELEPSGYFLMQPRTFILAKTRERVRLPKSSRIAARVEGRSTLARLGLVVHMTAPNRVLKNRVRSAG